MSKPILLFLLLISPLVHSGCTEKDVPSSHQVLPLSDSLAKTTVARDIHLTLYEGNRAPLQLSAQQASTYEKDQGATETLFSGVVRVQLTDSLGQRTSATCRKLLYLSPESLLTLSDSVVIDGFNGRRLLTDRLIWDRSSGKIRTEGFVVMVTENDSIRGYGLRANSDLSDYSVLNVTGSTTIRKKQR